MDNIKPDKIVADLVESGAYKSKLTTKHILIRGFLSGALLGFATVLAFITANQTGMGVLGALAFPVGFVMIILLGLELVTGNFATIPMAVMGRKTSIKNLFYNWTFAFTGNLIGSVFFGALFFIVATKFGHYYDTDIAKKITDVAINKTLAYKELGGEGGVVCFVKAMLCNWMVTLGVVMGLVSSSTSGKIFAIWLPIFTFFALGLEHCVVNMFVIPTAIMLDAPITVTDWWLWNQIPATIGNIVGGFFFTGVLLYLTHYKKEIPDENLQSEQID
ncbi:MAG: formate/nitrite transporter family protein [Bacteroidetes bacterium]|nr:formate/nitrite transporter family protein [Bacteroidota bacterium]NOG94882.1 formate/nitrite transporter family protein [Bacteroidota bacterium]